MPGKVEQLSKLFAEVRTQSLKIVEGLNAEDMLAQSMPDASPVKWHLAHTTWFFEAFILSKFFPHYKKFHPRYEYLFNSYYETVGERQARPERGLLTRPTIEDVFSYRSYIDDHMSQLLQDSHSAALHEFTIVGLHHEMQHQELILSDLLHLFSRNILHPALISVSKNNKSQREQAPVLEFTHFPAETVDVGAEDNDFSYDCERPRHTTYLTPFSLANRLVTNGEWLEFMADKGYDNSLLWLSDGWAVKQKQQWCAPLYWQQVDGTWFQFGLDGLQEVNISAPVCHISYYEANAFATWLGKRLPREFELETVSEKRQPTGGNFLEAGHWRPQTAADKKGLQQLYGDVWEWTQSSYLPHPNFKAELGALGEYNGKFMANQMVLKGGSCITPQKQIRSSYRNFFHPHQRWQFTGLRLAEDS